MSVFNRSEEQRCLDELHHPDEEVIGSLCRLSDRAVSPNNPNNMDQEKRIRREIANSNERRRMQSINAGFQSLRTLLPHHEGEKLSKAAILQQTAEYIYQLEQEKTSLLSQNCQLKRLVNQHEGAQEVVSAVVSAGASAGAGGKKRKLDAAVPLTAVPLLMSESSDEGLGSMSPEPISILGGCPDGAVVCTVSGDRDVVTEARTQLDRERRLRMHLEDQVRVLEHQLYPERIREITQQVHLQYHHQEVVEHELLSETDDAVAQLQVVSAASLPHVAHTTTILASPSPSPPPPPSPPPSHPITASPCHSMGEPDEEVDADDPRLPSVLEAAIKAEPKVEVERLPSPTCDDVMPQTRLFLNSTSRQNLETIVEAIRHLEGDHLFCDEPPPSSATTSPTAPAPTAAATAAVAAAAAAGQHAPLALTKKEGGGGGEPTQQQVAHRLLKVEMNPYLQFHALAAAGGGAAARSLQQQRPGVIVVKQHT